MRIRYDAKTKTLEYKDGSKEDFYCGSVLDSLSLILMDYKEGYLSTQQAYSGLLKLMVTQELSNPAVTQQPFNTKMLENLCNTEEV